jgi:hypothetical protein
MMNFSPVCVLLKLREKQRKKFFRDGINPNKNIPSELSVTSGETTRRKRKFSRHKEINRDQNDTVVNLSLSFNSCSAPFSAGVRLLWVGMFVLVAVWTSFLTQSIKDPKVVFYLEEANRQLTDERFYKKLDSDPTEEFSTKITQELKIMKENSHIDKNTFDYLKPVSFKCEGSASTSGRRWKSTNSEVFPVGCPFVETIGLPGLLT